MKRCQRCGKEKPLTLFALASQGHPRKTDRRVLNDPRISPDRRRKVCKACNKTAHRRKKGIPTRTDMQERSAERSKRKALRQLRILLQQLAVQKGEAEGEAYATIRYRTRYRTDPVFREKEIARTWANKEKQREYIADGTLTQEEIRRLFATATHCCYCAERMRSQDKTLDHVIPLSRGGKHSADNVVIACRSCNVSKRARTPAEWRLSA